MRAFKPVNQFLPFAAKGLLADAPHGSLGRTATRTPWRWDLGFVAKINLRCPRCGGWACSQQGAEAALTVAEEHLTEDIGKGVWKAGETTRGWSVRGLPGGSCYVPRTRGSCGWKGCLWGGGGGGRVAADCRQLRGGHISGPLSPSASVSAGAPGKSEGQQPGHTLHGAASWTQMKGSWQGAGGQGVVSS